MPLPFILGGAAALAGALGIKKGVDAYKDNEKAERLYDRAQELFDTTKERLDNTRSLTTEALTDLGSLKLQVWDHQFGRFISLVERVKHVDVQGQANVDNRLQYKISNNELMEMKAISLKAGEVVVGGLASVGSGALAGVAAYGGATFLASASTGTALASLSGAAATNATLAWFGGGSLAAGGLGIAGGTAILGGIIAGPALAVGGILLASKARENLAEARKNYAQAQQAAEEMENAISVMEVIKTLAEDFTVTIQRMNSHMASSLDTLEKNLNEAEEQQSKGLLNKIKKFYYSLIKKPMAIDYRKLTEEQKRALHTSYQFAQTLKILLETPILKGDGSPDASARQALETSSQLLPPGR